MERYNPYAGALATATGRLRDRLQRLKDIMQTFLDQVGGSERHVLENMLIFALRDNLQQITTHDNIERTELFDTGEKDFKELFGYELHLKTRAELPTVHPGAYNYGPSRDDGMDPVAPTGSLHHQYTILNNLHKRLIALEQRMGVN